ncbi:MAG: hypothetical protein RIR70_1211 [Pseudomonadota bacterium]|jgi:CyaY protein
MDEGQFNALADAALESLEAALDGCGGDFDIEVKPGGVLELEFDDGSKIIINRHSAAREIWVAAKSGGFHYRFEEGQWVNTRDGESLLAALSRLISAQGGGQVRLG